MRLKEIEGELMEIDISEEHTVDSTRQFRRNSWGSLARDNIDRVEYNMRGHRFLLKKEATDVSTIQGKRRKAHLHSVNIDLKNGHNPNALPNPTDAEGWKKVKLSGKRVEASYVKNDSWMEAGENDESFSHKPGNVKYRLVKES